MKNLTDHERYAKLARGENHHSAKIDTETVLSIREDCEHADKLREELKHYSFKAIAKRYGLSPQTIYEIKHGYIWSHV